MSHHLYIIFGCKHDEMVFFLFVLEKFLYQCHFINTVGAHIKFLFEYVLSYSSNIKFNKTDVERVDNIIDVIYNMVRNLILLICRKSTV